MTIREISSKVLLDFIRLQNTKRIRQTSFEFYQNATDAEFVAFGLFLENALIGVTAGAYTNQFGITLVDEAYRNKGHGTMLLAEKITRFKAMGKDYITLVAEDNALSRRMCDKCSMKEIGRQTFKRKGNEEYVAITYFK